MKLRHKIALTALGTLGVAFAAALVVFSYESPCGAQPTAPHDAPTMTAAVRRCYGSPAVITLEQLAKPVPGDNEILIKVRAASVNPVDWHTLRGAPYVMRMESGFGTPKNVRLGVDFAGTVEAVGRNVTDFKPGDDVFGGTGRNSAFAEYLTVSAASAVVSKPPNLSFEQAAAVPVAAVTALLALRDRGHVQAGQKVLINGASGGVGTFAVQIAKALGAEVTGVCSTRNLELVTSLGADHVVDYTREDFTRSGERYDLILDIAGGHSVADYRRVLKPGASMVVVGSTSKGAWLGPLTGMIGAAVYDPFVAENLTTLLATLRKPELLALRDLLEAGTVTPALDRTYAFHDVRDALAYLEEGHARAKVVLTFE